MRSGTFLTAAMASLLLLMTAAGAASAPIRPTVERGWPIAVRVGDWDIAAGGGVIGAANGDLLAYSDTPGDPPSIAMRIGPTGTVRWWRASDASCGNCAGRDGAGGEQPDGSFGPFGDSGRTWAVTATGREVAACEGVVRRDGACIQEFPFLDDVIGAITAQRDGVERWRYVDPDPVDPQYGMVPFRRVVSTGADTIAAALPAPSTSAGTVSATTLVGLRAEDGAVQWRRRVPGAWRLWFGTRETLVASAPTSQAVVLGPDGAERWRMPESQNVLAIDSDSRQVLAASRATPPVVRGRDLTTGRVVWTGRPPWPIRVFGTWRGGVIVAPISPGLHQVRGLDRTGRTRWIIGASTPIRDATGLADGSVAVMTESLTDMTGRGLVSRYRLVDAPRSIRRTVSLVRVRQPVACATTCGPARAAAPALRITTPMAMRVRVSVQTGGSRAEVVRFIAPAGVSLARLGGRAVPGSIMRVSWTERGETRTVRIRAVADR